MIKINQLNFTLPNSMNILDNVSCEIEEGEFVILLGSNGSGKSTLINLLNRHYLPSSGQIYFAGENINQISPQAYAKKIITLTQFVKQSLFLDLSILENARLIEAAYAPQAHKPREFKQQLAQYLAGFNEKLANSLAETVSNLSGGEQQILAFALYLKHQPKLLLLDEHTSALDPKTATKIMQFTAQIIKTHHLTCIMATHNLEFAMHYGNRVIALKDGSLVFDSKLQPEIRRDRTALLEKCY